jgi:TRAP-type transport system periplasmic protein
MRAQESPVHMSMYKAFGASATPIPTTEVPQALATGNVDGFDQSALYALATSWTKSIKYFTVSEHIYQPAAIVFNQQWFDALPPDLQAVVISAGRNIQGSGRTAVRDIFDELLEIMKSEKIEVVRHTDAERAVFKKAAQAAYADFRKEQNKDAARLLDLANASLAAYRKGK